jgi:hypothetical protein
MVSLFGLAVTARYFLRLVFSSKPDAVDARTQMAEGYRKNIKEPFLQGYKAESNTEWIRIDVPQGKRYGLYRHLSSLSFASIFLVVVLCAIQVIPQDMAWILGLPVPTGAFFLWKMWRNRARKTTVRVWKGTREPVADWR